MSGKKYADSIKTFDRDQQFTPTEALALVKSLAPAKFDETVDIAVRLGVDPRKADQMVRGTVALPSGTGKDVRVAVFASGEAASFQARPSRPLLIAQVQASPLLADGQAQGSWRLYAWTNGNTTDLSESRQRHAGWGLSVDQRAGQGWNLFGRYGQRTRGEGAFDRALTLGVERDMAAWGRAGEVLALALGRLATGKTWQSMTAADGSLVGFGANGAEQVAELYYRFQIGESLQLSPDLQWIRRPGGHAAASVVRVLGLRATLGF